MKLLIILPILLAGLIPLAFADVSIGSEKYDVGDLIIISGSVVIETEKMDLEGVSEEEQTNRPQIVSIQIIDPVGSIKYINQLSPDKSGNFYDEILAEENWKYKGYYKTIISFDNERIEKGFWFNQDPRPDLLKAETIEESQEPKLSQHDQDIERLQLEIQKKDNRITELENQVFDLQNEIDKLNQIIHEQIKVIMNTLVSLKP